MFSPARGSVLNRLDRLVNSGAILDFAIRVRDDYSPNTSCALMRIEIAGKSTSEAIRKLRGIPELTALHSTNGNWGLIDGVLNSETNLLLSSV